VGLSSLILLPVLEIIKTGGTMLKLFLWGFGILFVFFLIFGDSVEETEEKVRKKAEKEAAISLELMKTYASEIDKFCENEGSVDIDGEKAFIDGTKVFYENNYEEAFKLFQKACCAKEAGGCFTLSTMYSTYTLREGVQETRKISETYSYEDRERIFEAYSLVYREKGCALSPGGRWCPK